MTRVTKGDFQFPLGVYPVEEMAPKGGYTLHFESADGDDDDGDWEEWPDRYVFDAVISAHRVEALCRSLLTLFPGRVYPILDILGHDAFREIDPYISYDLIGLDRLMECLRRYRDFFFEDGMCGFGAMSEEPFFYVFVDEHKIVTIRSEPVLKEKVEKILAAFDLEETPDPAGADSAAHEHRGVLLPPEEDPDLYSFDEIVEYLREDWRLLLNIDAETNLDADSNDLGTTAWRCLVKVIPDADVEETAPKPARYIEVLLGANCLRQAEETATSAAIGLMGDKEAGWEEPFVVSSERLTHDMLLELLTPSKRSKLKKRTVDAGEIVVAKWLD